MCACTGLERGGGGEGGPSIYPVRTEIDRLEKVACLYGQGIGGAIWHLRSRWAGLTLILDRMEKVSCLSVWAAVAVGVESSTVSGQG